MPGTIAVVVACVAFYNGLIIPAAGTLAHVVFGAIFGVIAVLTGWRTVVITRRRSAGRFAGVFGIAIGGIGLAMLAYQTLVILTHGAVPPPFWAPYAHR